MWIAAATGTAAVAIAVTGALVASQTGAVTVTGSQTVLTAVVLRHMASATQTAMTSGRADIDWTSGGSTVTQHIAFDGANWEDTLPPRAAGQNPTSSGSQLHRLTWTGETIEKIVDGKDYHYPAFAFGPTPHIVAGWMRIVAPGASAPLNIPDPRTLLSVLSPSAGFVADGYTTVDGVRVEHLRATTPGAVAVTPLNSIIQSEPANPRLSAINLWVSQSDVVLKAQFTVTGPAAAAGVSVAVTFSQIGQPQPITAPSRYTTVGGKG